MILDRNLARYLVSEDEPIFSALQKIDSNRQGIVFCVDAQNQLRGVLTDGDFRRGALKVRKLDVAAAVSNLMNRSFTSASIDDGIAKIENLSSGRIRFIPLLDQRGRIVAVVRPRKEEFVIGEHKIGAGHPVFIIAEIGNNHNGSFDFAKTLVDAAVSAGADCAKFQMRDLGSLYKNAGDANDASEDLGSQYVLDLLARFQLSQDELFKIFDYCDSRGILPLCTPWDEISVHALDSYGMQAFKVASADLVNHDLLKVLAKKGRPLICSTGMSTDMEINDSIRLLNNNGAEFALLHCNSTYPAPFRNLNLSLIKSLRDLGKCPVGYSSHDRGYNAVLAAVALGANIIEKHFTIDRSMEGNDHRVSLMPDEFAEMVIGIRQVEEAIGVGGVRQVSQGERMNRENLGKSLVVNRNIKIGETIEESMIDVRSPGRGLPPYRRAEIVGRQARRPLASGDILFETDLAEVSCKPRNYEFRRPFGIPVRYHDLATLGSVSNFDLLEFHFSYKDLEEDLYSYVKPFNCELIVHAPDLFAGDHLLDLCSLDLDYRMRSIEELSRVIKVTRRLQKFFKEKAPPRIIVSVGGFTQDAPLPLAARKDRYHILLDSLSKVDISELEILPQTMPPFPWYFGGQRYQNLFIDPNEIVEMNQQAELRVCFDVSHSKLACTYFKWSFTEFIRKVGPCSGHLHIADALGVDGEGLQIGEGDIVVPEMAEALERFAPHVSFIPEIWQGHKNEGEGFWVALERLEKYI